MELNLLGKMLIIMGIVVVIIGALVLLMGKIPFLGKLPGDISIRRGNFSFYFPIATCILISLILTLVFTFLLKK
jgi:hypothetical protein